MTCEERRDRFVLLEYLDGKPIAVNVNKVIYMEEAVN